LHRLNIEVSSPFRLTVVAHTSPTAHSKNLPVARHSASFLAKQFKQAVPKLFLNYVITTYKQSNSNHWKSSIEFW